MSSFVDKPMTAMITGAYGGLGRALVSAFSGSFSVILHCRCHCDYVDPPGILVKGDLRDSQTISALSLAANDGLDVLINNAAVYSRKQLSEMNDRDVVDLLEVNLLVPILLVKALWRQLSSRNGMIVNISSIANVSASAGESVYAATKAGLSGFSRAIRWEAKASSIRVVDVCLGAMRTRMKQDHEDFDFLIDPAETASVIVGICSQNKTMDVSSIEILRSSR